MGCLSLSVWNEIEKRIKNSLWKTADLVVGTSIGAITGGMLSSGAIDSKELMELYPDVMRKTFSNRIRFYPKYSRKFINEKIVSYVGRDFLMSSCLTKVIITAVKAEDKKNHYMKSWENKDGMTTLKKSLTRSYAAPWYFGKFRDSEGTWLDGGTGSQNTPIIAGIWEAMRQNWLGREAVHILSIGTGYYPETRLHKQLKRMSLVRELLMFFDPLDGGLARYQSMTDNIEAARNLVGNVDGFSFQHIDYQLPKKMHGIDKIEYMDDYIKIGKQISKRVNMNILEKSCT